MFYQTQKKVQLIANKIKKKLLKLRKGGLYLILKWKNDKFSEIKKKCQYPLIKILNLLKNKKKLIINTKKEWL